MSPIDVHKTQEPQAARIALAGELDIATVDEVEREIADGEELPDLLVMDLSGLSFMDSTGLRMILTTDARQRAAGKRLVLVPGPESVHRVFRLALLEDRLEFQPMSQQDVEG